MYYQLNNSFVANLDQTGNGYGLTDIGAPIIDIGRFQGTSDSLSTWGQEIGKYSSTIPSFASADPRTLLFWVNVNSDPGSGVNGYLVRFNKLSIAVFYAVYYTNNAGTYQLIFNKNLTGTVAVTITLNYRLIPGKWYLIGLVYANTNLYGYINGNLVGSVAGNDGNGATVVEPDVLAIHGYGRLGGFGLLNGAASKICEVANFSRGLSIQEMSQYYKWATSNNVIQRKGFLWALTAITLTLTETITTTDTILRSILRTLSESITTSDTISNIKVMFKALTESITTSDSILRTVSRTLSETISTTDTIMKQLGRTLTEAITTSDTFTKIRSTTITFIEKFSIVQFLTNLLNGGTGIWTKESGATTTWTQEGGATTNWTPEGGATTNWTQEPYP